LLETTQQETHSKSAFPLCDSTAAACPAGRSLLGVLPLKAALWGPTLQEDEVPAAEAGEKDQGDPSSGKARMLSTGTGSGAVRAVGPVTAAHDRSSTGRRGSVPCQQTDLMEHSSLPQAK
jgi:hypothetical protein